MDKTKARLVALEGSFTGNLVGKDTVEEAALVLDQLTSQPVIINRVVLISSNTFSNQRRIRIDYTSGSVATVYWAMYEAGTPLRSVSQIENDTPVLGAIHKGSFVAEVDNKYSRVISTNYTPLFFSDGYAEIQYFFRVGSYQSAVSKSDSFLVPVHEFKIPEGDVVSLASNNLPSGGEWTGGLGVFLPDRYDPTAIYVPHTSEVENRAPFEERYITVRAQNSLGYVSVPRFPNIDYIGTPTVLTYTNGGDTYTCSVAVAKSPEVFAGTDKTSYGTEPIPIFSSVRRLRNKYGVTSEEPTIGGYYDSVSVSIISGAGSIFPRTSYTLQQIQEGVAEFWYIPHSSDIGGTVTIRITCSPHDDDPTVALHDDVTFTINSVPDGISHATSDGNYYASRNGNWASLTGVFTTVSDVNSMLANVTSQVFNVKDYGAVGNGSNDDTNAIQNAVNAAVQVSGVVYFPEPTGYYKITDTIEVHPVGTDDQVPIFIKGQGSWNMIEFQSTTGRACFEFRGIKRGLVEGIHVYCKNDDQIAWDIVCDANHQSQSSLRWTLCHVSLAGKASTGWRLTTEGGGADISVISFDTCNVQSSDGRAAIGWLDTNANGLAYVWMNCGSSHVHSFYNNMGRLATLSAGIDASQTSIPVNNPEMFPQRGARIKIDSEYIDYASVSGSNLIGCTRGVGSTPASHGSGSLCYIDTWQGGGGEGKIFINTVNSYNEHDFYFGTTGTYSIYGGRFEVGKKFARFGVWGTTYTMFNVNGATLTQYGGGSGADAGVVFHIGTPLKLNLESCMISQVDYTANMIKDMANVGIEHSGPGGSITIRNCSIQNTTGVRQFWTLQSHYSVTVENTIVANGAGQGIATITTIPKNNYAATSAPTTGDDANDGYSIGSNWLNVSADDAYICLDATVGAAVWKKTTP